MKSSNSRLPAYYKSDVTKITPDGPDWTGKIAKNSERVWNLPARTSEPTTYFVNSMSDLFHENISDEQIVEVFEEMNRLLRHKFQVLTKRPNRMLRLSQKGLIKWTSNIWAGVTIENDSMVKRADLLRKIDAHVRFISAEPLLSGLPSLDLADIDWVIAGGESGPRARPMDGDWARDLRDRCIDQTMRGYEVVFHFKQWGAYGEDGVKRSKAANGHLLDGVEWHDMPDKRSLPRHGAHSIPAFQSSLHEQRERAVITHPVI